jgi:site-specific DNA recombinase
LPASRFYVFTGVIKRGPEACSVRRVPAAEVERAVVDQVRALVVTPAIIVRTWKQAREQDGSITEEEVRAALADFSALWEELFPAEQSRVIQLLVERVEIQPDRLSIKLRKDGLVSLANEIHQKAAA